MPLGTKQIAGALTAAAVALGGGGTAGYYLHEPPPPPAFPIERVVSLEQWRTEERGQLVTALKDSTATNVALNQTLVLLTERIGSTRESVTDHEKRIRALELRRR
jgi:hypothetical protein